MKSLLRPLFLAFFALFLLSSCGGVKFPDVKTKASARQVTVSMSFGLDLVVQSCVGIMQGLAEESREAAGAFGKRCYAVVKPMSRLIEKAAEAVDSWDQNKDAFAQVACTAKIFSGTFWPASKALIEEFTAAPKEMDDVMLFVNVLAGVAAPECK